MAACFVCLSMPRCLFMPIEGWKRLCHASCQSAACLNHMPSLNRAARRSARWRASMMWASSCTAPATSATQVCVCVWCGSAGVHRCPPQSHIPAYPCWHSACYAVPGQPPCRPAAAVMPTSCHSHAHHVWTSNRACLLPSCRPPRLPAPPQSSACSRLSTRCGRRRKLRPRQLRRAPWWSRCRPAASATCGCEQRAASGGLRTSSIWPARRLMPPIPMRVSCIMRLQRLLHGL